MQSWEEDKYAQAQHETSDLYCQQHLIEPCNQDIFYSTEAEHFSHEMTSQGLQQWINTQKLVITSSIQPAQNSGTHHMHNIVLRPLARHVS